MIGGKEHRIQSDSADFMLCVPKVKIDKETKVKSDGWSPILFYGTLEGLLQNLYARKIRASDAKTIAELRNVMDETRKELLGVYGEVNFKGDNNV
jgi:hypothetical protein